MARQCSGPPHSATRVFGLVGGGLVAEGDLCPGLTEEADGRGADAAGASGDEGGAAGEGQGDAGGGRGVGHGFDAI